MAEKSKTNEAKEPTLSFDWNKLSPVSVLSEFAGQGKRGAPYANKSLELILKDIGKTDPIDKNLMDPAIMSKTIKSINDTYAQFKGRQTIGYFLNEYDKDLTDYLGDDAKMVPEELKPYLDMSYADVVKEMGKLNYIIEGKKHGMSTDKQVEDAKKEIEGYEKAIGTIALVEEPILAKFRLRVAESLTKEGLKEMYHKPEAEKEAA